MARLHYETAGESHGPAVLTLIHGLPRGLPIDLERINLELRRRQGGYGRSARQRIETDQALIKSGVRLGLTTGGPMVVELINKDSRLDRTPAVHDPRPGHADFAGSIKWLTTDCRDALERASARETAARVCAGAVAQCLLSRFGIAVIGFVHQIGTVAAALDDTTFDDLSTSRNENDVYCPDSQAAERMITEIDQAKKDGDTLGGIVEVHAKGLLPGLGSCMRWQDKLDGRLLQAVGSIQAIKGVEIGAGFAVAGLPGSQIHDELDFDEEQQGTSSFGFVRRSNNAGGLEGGMTNGQNVMIRAAMKPISTLRRGLDTVNLETRQSSRSAYERSDVCAVPAASVVAENVVAFELARALLEKFPGDTCQELDHAYWYFCDAARQLGKSSDARC